MKALTLDKFKELKSKITDDFGMPNLILIENAVFDITEYCIEYLSQFHKPSVIVAIGLGEKAAYGYGVARRLHLSNIDVTILMLTGSQLMTEETSVNFDIARNMGIPIINSDNKHAFAKIKNCDLIIDSIISCDINRSLYSSYSQIIEAINKYSKYTISIECPSGIDCTTGKINFDAIRADVTIAFFAPKVGMYLFPAVEYVGEIFVTTAGIPEDVVSKNINSSVTVLTDRDIKPLLPTRAVRSNKFTFGRVISLAGSDDMPGAALLTASAVYKSGGGMVKACSTKHVTDIIHANLKEAITLTLPNENGFLSYKSYEKLSDSLEWADVIVIGPGLGNNPITAKFVQAVIENTTCPIILDADGINCVAQNMQLMNFLSDRCILTPHFGEMSRLNGKLVEEIQDNVIETALEFSQNYNVVTLLKDAKSIIANPNGEICINQSGNPAMAKAGSGDVLTGIIAALVAQGLDLFISAALGAYIHGKAGDLAAQNLGAYGVLASDIINFIPNVIAI